MKFKIFDNVPLLYKSMLEDIKLAEKNICLETYIYGEDSIGLKFKNALLKKAKEGVKIKVLIDGWGSSVDEEYFKDLPRLGAEVKIFRKFRYTMRIFTENHKRDHRKLLLIDDNIAYIGSANIAKHFLKWREITLRLEGEISEKFKESFMHLWEAPNIFKFKIFKTIHCKNYEIISDIASHFYTPTQKKYLKMMKNAKKSILIETPYFVPPFRIRKAIKDAAKRGIKVILLTPHSSDVKIIDIIKEKYLGKLYKSGIKIYYYKPKILHSKFMVVDNTYFILGSSNLDYRSFVYQYELNLYGRDKEISNELSKKFYQALAESEPFEYKQWKNRPLLNKVLEKLIYIFRTIL
ncbi:MAG: phosphatidylserine/phosphatidylglycerophosphate/cardiolipin synthase family protein [Nanoarchaeota archaeon]